MTDDSQTIDLDRELRTKDCEMFRNRDAKKIQQGACNPVAILATMHAHGLAMYHNGFGTDAVRNDPAMRIMCHQLAYLMAVGQIDDSLDEYANLMISIERGC